MAGGSVRLGNETSVKAVRRKASFRHVSRRKVALESQIEDVVVQATGAQQASLRRAIIVWLYRVFLPNRAAGLEFPDVSE